MCADEYLWKLDLTNSFSARSPPWAVEAKPSDPNKHYDGAEGTIWNVGMGTFVTIGGWFSPRRASTGEIWGEPYTDPDGNTKLPAARMFTYNPASDEWTSALLDSKIQRISTASIASSERKRRGYVLGGLLIMEEWTGLVYPAISQTWLDTMTQYDFQTKKWKTEELPGQIGKTVDGGLIALDRVGEDGVLVFLGGQEQTLSSEPRRSMKTIWVYDIATAKWHSQTTTGEIPEGRRQSCFFMVPAPDQSSYQIYIFSGTLATEDTVLDLYVLTVPGFIWTKISLADAGYPDTYGMNAHQCSPHAAGRQMLIVPGNMNASDTAEFQFLCNNGTGIRIFDTQQWKFTNEFDPTKTEIGVPEPILTLIGGTTQGGAKVTQPEAGWQNATLGKIFSKRNEPINYNDNPTKTSDGTISTATPSSAPASEKSKLSSGAIAGIAVGAVIGCSAVFAIVYCLYRRRRNNIRRSAPVELNSHRAPVEAAAVVPGELPGAYYATHQELGSGYMPSELMDARDGKVKPVHEYQVKSEPRGGE